MATNNSGQTETNLRAARPRNRAVLAYVDRRVVGRAVCDVCGAEIDAGEQATVRAATSTGEPWRNQLICGACDQREIHSPTLGRWEFIVQVVVVERGQAPERPDTDAMLTAPRVLDCSAPGHGTRATGGN